MVAREIIAVNLLKSMALDAVATIECLAELGMLEDIFSDFLSLDPLARLPHMPDQLRSKIEKSSHVAQVADRAREFEKALAADRWHQATYPDCSLDEIVYLLTFWLGRCPALAGVTSDGRVV